MLALAKAVMEGAYAAGRYKLAAAVAMLSECGWYNERILADYDRRVLRQLDADIKRLKHLNGHSYAKKQTIDMQPIPTPTPEPNAPKNAPKNTPKAPKVKAFKRPTVDEVAEYCKERGNGIDAQQFCDFYEAKGWVVGKSPMRDWRAAVRTWEQRHKQDAAMRGNTKRAGIPAPMEQLTLTF